ncbi:MAG: hypothetical protein ABW221_14115 [Vicinamibacteria bacterium]
MTKKRLVGVALALAAVAVARPAHARDPWEYGPLSDDGVNEFGLTGNTLSPGLAQMHDLYDFFKGTNDQDWSTVPTVRYHSYEARVSGYSADFATTPCSGCAQFERVDRSGAILTEDVGVVNGGPGTGNGPANDRSVRWIASTSANSTFDFVRVRGSADPEDETHVYTIRYWDTTYRVPRWNAANGQTTVLVVTSLVQANVAARIQFFGEDASLVTTVEAILTRNKPLVYSSASNFALTGKSGFALIAHNGGYGALTGKAVSLDPATGFTFDTALEAIPQ